MPSVVDIEKPKTAECPSSRAALYSRSLVIATPHLISVPIRRPAVTLLVSLNERPFNVAVPGVGSADTLAALVGAGQGRVLHAASCDLLSINLEPGHALFRPLQRALSERPLQSLAPAGWSGVQDLLRRCFEADVPNEPQADAIVELCRLAGVALDGSLLPSDRVWELLAFIDAGFPEGVSLSHLADKFYLSESRLSHLFADEVGIPLRTYLLWRRYRLAFSRLSDQSTLTRLACDSGFADAAHLTRTFVGYFGFSPKRILHSCFIQDLTRG